MDLEDLLVSLYVLVDEWWQRKCPPTPRKPGRPLSLSHSEVLTLAILAQWPRFRSERDFFRFADAHLRPYFPNLLSHGQLNRRIRALEPELKALQRDLAETLAEPSGVYHVLDPHSFRLWLGFELVIRASSPAKRPSAGAFPRRSGCTASR
jgi:hypothetical protein